MCAVPIDEFGGMPWFCDMCGASGILPAGWCGTEAIGEHRDASPDCEGSAGTIRCLPRFGQDRERWREIGIDLRVADGRRAAKFRR